MSKKRTGLLISAAALLGVAALGFATSGFQNWNPDDMKEKFIPTIEDPSEEPLIVNPFDTLPVNNSNPGIIFTYSDEVITPLSAAAYRSSLDYGEVIFTGEEGDQAPFTFNSLKMFKGDGGEYEARLGFPTTINEKHYDIFGLGKTYSSWLLGNYKVLNDYGITFSNENNSELTVIYRTNEDLEWRTIAHYELWEIEGDNRYYQFGIVYNTNSKSNSFILKPFTLPSASRE